MTSLFSYKINNGRSRSAGTTHKYKMSSQSRKLFQEQKLIVVCWQCSRVRLYHVQECLSGALVFIVDDDDGAGAPHSAVTVVNSARLVCFGTLRALFFSTLCLPGLQ